MVGFWGRSTTPFEPAIRVADPENPTTGYGVIAMNLEGKTSDRPFRIDPPVTEGLES